MHDPTGMTGAATEATGDASGAASGAAGATAGTAGAAAGAAGAAAGTVAVPQAEYASPGGVGTPAGGGEGGGAGGDEGGGAGGGEGGGAGSGAGGGAGGPRRRWWSPLQGPALEPISAHRAYAEVLFAYSAFFLTGVIAAGLLLANRYKDVFSNASWALYVPQAVEVLLQAAVAVVLVLLLSARRGVSPATLGLRLQRRPDGRFAAGATTRVLAWAIFALIVGGVVNALLQTGHLPTAKPSAPELLFGVADSVQAGIVEELVVLAFVVVTLRQARRPLWEITLVALVLRGSYHIYYGPGVVGILIWAALYYWIYLRTQALIPLMVVHAVWDTVGFLSQRWAGVAVVALLVTVAIWIAAPITWAVERGDRNRGSGPGWPAAGGPGWAPGMGPGWPAGGGPGWASGGGPGWEPGGGPGWAPASGWESGAGGWGPGAGGAAPGAGGWAPGPGGAAPGAGARGSGPWMGPAQPAPPAADWIPPGWHPDPSGVHYWRWWDGYRWTDHVAGG